MQRAKSKNTYDVVQLTRELADEPNQKTIRPFFKDITSVEVRSGGLAVNTRSTRYDIPVGHWIMKDQRDGVSILSDVAFKMNFQLISD